LLLTCIDPKLVPAVDPAVAVPNLGTNDELPADIAPPVEVNGFRLD
jgi:hypothetical protein